MPAGAHRRTQAERTAQTRHRLLDAAIDSLVEVGYAATSTTEVARRAGVSRGAQTHHFPTKSELVVAAVEHVFTIQAETFHQVFDRLPPEDRTLTRAVDQLWDIVGGPAYSAILELIVAARTDEALSPVVQGVAASFEQTVQDLLAELFPDVAGHDFAADLLGFAFSLLQGAAISDMAGFFGPSERTVGMLRALAALGPEALAQLITTLDPEPPRPTTSPRTVSKESRP